LLRFFNTINKNLKQPAFTLADSNRCIQSKRILQTVLEDTRRSELRLLQTQERGNIINKEIFAIQDRMAQLLQEVERKKIILQAAHDEAEEMTIRIQFNRSKRNGLCIRFVLNFFLFIIYYFFF
jgi:transcriptional regulator of heat shock response